MDNFSVGLSLIRQVPSPNHSSNPKIEENKMCEHCRNKFNPKEVLASFSYKKHEDGEHESKSMVSKILNTEELENVLTHLLTGLRTYAVQVCHISRFDFDNLTRCSLLSDYSQEEALMLEQESSEIPVYYN